MGENTGGSLRIPQEYMHGRGQFKYVQWDQRLATSSVQFTSVQFIFLVTVRFSRPVQFSSVQFSYVFLSLVFFDSAAQPEKTHNRVVSGQLVGRGRRNLRILHIHAAKLRRSCGALAAQLRRSCGAVAAQKLRRLPLVAAAAT